MNRVTIVINSAYFSRKVSLKEARMIAFQKFLVHLLHKFYLEQPKHTGPVGPVVMAVLLPVIVASSLLEILPSDMQHSWVSFLIAILGVGPLTLSVVWVIAYLASFFLLVFSLLVVWLCVACQKSLGDEK